MAVNQAAAKSSPVQKESNAVAVKWGGLLIGALMLILLTVLVAELDGVRGLRSAEPADIEYYAPADVYAPSD